MGTKTSGAKEWGKSLNIAKGCSHNCAYCYAKAAAKRFGWKKDWSNMELKQEMITRRYQKRNGTIMFPTSHDITPEIMKPACQVLGNLLRAGNNVLIVSKAHRKVFKALSHTAKDHKGQIEFRATITTMDEQLAKQYEPGAPSPRERLLALWETKMQGFRTSVSIEPFLDNPVFTIKSVSNSVETIWLGPMNNVPLAFELKDLYKPSILKSMKDFLDNSIYAEQIHYKDAYLNRMQEGD